MLYTNHTLITLIQTFHHLKESNHFYLVNLIIKWIKWRSLKQSLDLLLSLILAKDIQMYNQVMLNSFWVLILEQLRRCTLMKKKWLWWKTILIISWQWTAFHLTVFINILKKTHSQLKKRCLDVVWVWIKNSHSSILTKTWLLMDQNSITFELCINTTEVSICMENF